MAIEDLRVMGRATQGVKLINLKGNDSIAAVAKVMKDDEEEVVVDEEGNVVQGESIERVKPVLEVLEDDGSTVDEDDEEEDEAPDDEADDSDDDDEA